MVALITGGSGYFGSLLTNKLLSMGYKCKIFDLNDTQDRSKKIDFFQGDIRNYKKIRDVMSGVDIVFHNVAQVPLAKDFNLFQTVNVFGTDNLLKAALDSKVQKVIYTSSSAVYGIPEYNPVTEDMIPYPGEEYGIAKYKGEMICQDYIKKGLNISIIRPRTIMGHGRLGIFQILFEWIKDGYNIPVLGDGSNVYQFVHADDLAYACILASKNERPDIYNCGADVFGTMREVLENLCSYAQTGSKVKSVPKKLTIFFMKLASILGISPLGAYHSMMYGNSMYFDLSKIKKDLNWEPKFSNNEMFIESYKWYLKNRELILNQNQASHHRSAIKQGILSLVKRCI